MSDSRLAAPGDPDLDCFLEGLRLGPVVASGSDGDDRGYHIEMMIEFDTTEAAGWWLDNTDTPVVPDRITSLTVTFGATFDPGHEHRALAMIDRLTAWAKSGAVLTMSAAPGKWTRLSSPGHPAGSELPIPRSTPTQS
jgi:hypothetical protein